MSCENLPELLIEKLSLGQNLLEKLHNLSHINGVNKLKRKINQELNFLKKKKFNNTIRIENIQCTNLNHFVAVVDTLNRTPNCVEVDKTFGFNDRKLSVDIVSHNGFIWIKVIARNSKSLLQAVEGDTSYGTKSIVDHADDFLECAKLYPVCFQNPKVIFHFSQGITPELLNVLQTTEITVTTNENFVDIIEKLQLNKPINQEIYVNNFCNLATKKLNLDVSSMIAYVSNLTNGYCNYIYKEALLTQQAQWEAERPVKPILDKLFNGRQLLCCETALNDFKSIIETVGGETEKCRAKELIDRLCVLSSDVVETAIEKHDIKLGGKIKKRSLLVFEFGNQIQSVTVTANEGFVRSVKQQGVEYAVFIHESRALTEQKEKTATKRI
ncbi:UPF0415 protein C7orf25 homolog [Chrysoperla carnea]|uniref:UPF0415 protein C7orf25 homolog n=1 Tax=Chrysoperla carnea TaxID=189513 RepID=UPI001D09357A|nr:UPF0415 protein C7orf25 homolog [Chrysoperla carnea]